MGKLCIRLEVNKLFLNTSHTSYVIAGSGMVYKEVYRKKQNVNGCISKLVNSHNMCIVQARLSIQYRYDA